MDKPCPEIKQAPRTNVTPAPNNREKNSEDATYVPLESIDSESLARVSRKRPLSQSMPRNQRGRLHSKESDQHMPKSPSADELGRPEIERPDPGIIQAK